MADDKSKKPKIDLKARLGKTQMGLQPAALPAPLPGPTATPMPQSGDAPAVDAFGAPAPVAPASRPSVPAAIPAPPAGMPQGIAPPPGLSPGIPLPPFGPQPVRRAAAEPKQSAAQQTIKVDVGEEIILERKKSRSRIFMGALAGAAIGLGIGFVAGGSSEKGDRSKAAARGAGLLEKDVKTATEKLKELDTKLTEAADKLKNKTFPDDLGTSLGGLTIPFDDLTLEGKELKGMPSRLFKQVLDYTDGCKNANKLRESLKNLAGFTKDPITKAWKEEKDPLSSFSVVFHQEGSKVAAELVPNPAPFAWKGDWADHYKVTRLEGGKPTEKDAKRYAKGDLPGGDLTAIPVDPKTTAAFTSDVMIGKLNGAIYALRIELEGNKENPTNETPGIIKAGEDLANELHKASQNQ